MLLSHLGEDLAVESEAFLLESVDERAVRLVSVLADSSVQAYDPELPKVGLLIFAVVEGVLAGVHQRLLCKAFLRAPSVTESLRALQYVPAALCSYDASFYSCHT